MTSSGQSLWALIVTLTLTLAGNRDGFPSLTRHDKCPKSSSHRLPDLLSCDCVSREMHRWSTGLHGYKVTKVIGCRAPSLQCLLASSSGCHPLFLSPPASPLNSPSCSVLRCKFTSRPVSGSDGEFKQGGMRHRRENGANVIPC